jgi:hypothetical protein
LSNNTNWPVYPPIARELGVYGSFVFRRGGMANLESGESKYINIENLIIESYNEYKKYDKRIFDAPHIVRARDILTRII